MITAVNFIFPLLDAIVGVFLKEVLDTVYVLLLRVYAKFPLLTKSRHANGLLPSVLTTWGDNANATT